MTSTNALTRNSDIMKTPVYKFESTNRKINCVSDSRSGRMKLDDAIQMSVRMRFAYDAMRCVPVRQKEIAVAEEEGLLVTRTVEFCDAERVVCRNFHRNIIDIYLHDRSAPTTPGGATHNGIRTNYRPFASRFRPWSQAGAIPPRLPGYRHA